MPSDPKLKEVVDHGRDSSGGIGVSTQRCILFSFAHPDDESFLVAGLACKYSTQGASLVLVTATLGEAGKCGDPPVCAPPELAATRERELRQAVDILGIQHLHLLGYQDRKLDEAPPDAIRGQLVRLIRQHRPQIVITFDPNGFNRHPDHIAICRFTSDAVAAAGDPRWFPDGGAEHQVARLLWSSPKPSWKTGPGDSITEEAGVDFVLNAEHWKDRKVSALRAHRSQHLAIDRIFFSQPDVDRRLNVETFRQAWGPALNRRPIDDLFEGVS